MQRAASSWLQVMLSAFIQCQFLFMVSESPDSILASTLLSNIHVIIPVTTALLSGATYLWHDSTQRTFAPG
ncbi:hypothetical protein L211DRAFT_841227 [Terfezia boudieri ATCC MYA-4762]|uniref:Uncharacterized protein n=1 Tax=Terfezia boudieri ATCC MYA-4762 TaxID=1051890 RepID=A0A3N4LJT2_9PEZI|nr:hypothetical protein L211DRAFT_841227 [Terfezia boudieri ATCC MYA-4762]